MDEKIKQICKFYPLKKYNDKFNNDEIEEIAFIIFKDIIQNEIRIDDFIYWSIYLYPISKPVVLKYKNTIITIEKKSNYIHGSNIYMFYENHMTDTYKKTNLEELSISETFQNIFRKFYNYTTENDYDKKYNIRFDIEYDNKCEEQFITLRCFIKN